MVLSSRTRILLLAATAQCALALQPTDSRMGASKLGWSLHGSSGIHLTLRGGRCQASEEELSQSQGIPQQALTVDVPAATAAVDHIATTPPLAVGVELAHRLVLGSVLLLVANAGAAATGAARTATTGAGVAVVVPTITEILAMASKKALGGGLAGSLAGVIQVLALMWMRTTMNYQYRYGTSMREALATLYKQGGIGRFYQGLPYALIQTPLSRFGDTAANTGVLAIFDVAAPTMHIGLKTAFASASGSLWRIAITPIDTLKTTMQVEGKEAMAQVANKVRASGVGVLYQGALANAAASFVGSYPWYFTFNLLRELLPHPPVGVVYLKLLRNAAAGLGATCVSDCISNVIRVLKTAVQTSPETITYLEAAHKIIETDGVVGLLSRGLGTRLLTNGLQASIFSVLWKILEERFT